MASSSAYSLDFLVMMLAFTLSYGETNSAISVVNLIEEQTVSGVCELIQADSRSEGKVRSNLHKVKLDDLETYQRAIVPFDSSQYCSINCALRWKDRQSKRRHWCSWEAYNHTFATPSSSCGYEYVHQLHASVRICNWVLYRDAVYFNASSQEQLIRAYPWLLRKENNKRRREAANSKTTDQTSPEVGKPKPEKKHKLEYILNSPTPAGKA